MPGAGLPDPVTFEIIRHKLHQVIDEAILALENVSGSPTTAEGHDMMVSLYRADGSLMVGGVGFLHHLSSASQAVRNIIDRFGGEVREGDVYMLNDSYEAALHPPDVYIIAPIFFEDVLRGFVANFVHVNDIGAVDPGGFSPNSRSRFHEGFQTQGLKIVDAGEPRRDVIDTVLNQVREPDMVALDLRSQLAANHVAVDRMGEMFERHGPETVDAVSDELIRQSERLMRERLRELPDGVWRLRQYLDMPDRLHTVQLALEKRGDGLTFDFTGTGPQSELGINNSYWATLGAVLAPLYPLLAWDITWNEGMLRPVKLVAPSETLVHCVRPAPVSVATVSMIKVANNMSNLLLGRLLDASPTHHERASAVWDGVHSSMHFFGKQHGGESFIVSITDSFAGSGGAQAGRDGVDLGGELANGVSRWANAETHELHNPVLYLYRRLVPDSGGAGANRGGLTHEYALIPHQADGGSIGLVLTTKGLGVPMSLGLSGGYPACNAGAALFRGIEVSALPSSLAEMEGVEEPVQWGDYEVGPGDAFYQRFMGGGGYGDPIAREPERVAGDVAAGAVSRQVACRQYGVILTEQGNPDLAPTRKARLAIRIERLGQPVEDAAGERRAPSQTGMRINAFLQRTGAGTQCTWCGHLICAPSEAWKQAAVRREVSTESGGPDRESLEEILLRQFYCGGCGSLLDMEVARRGDPLVLDEIESWPRDEAVQRAAGAGASA